MQKTTLLLSLLVSIAPVLDTSSAHAAEPRGSTQTERFFSFGGHTRSYYLHLPENLPDGAPLVFVIHGYGGSGKHDWPGSWGNRDINASEEVWKFLKRFVDSGATD